MVAIIEHIDAISRREKKGVLWARFKRMCSSLGGEKKIIISFLDKNSINWEYCGHLATDSIMVLEGASGIYIDIDFKLGSDETEKIVTFFEEPNGKSKFNCVDLCFLSYDDALKNSHHDEPGYWDRKLEQI